MLLFQTKFQVAKHCMTQASGSTWKCTNAALIYTSIHEQKICNSLSCSLITEVESTIFESLWQFIVLEIKFLIIQFDISLNFERLSVL